jgi:hypothetical protein
MKILLTNWINLLGIFVVTFAFSVMQMLTKADLSYNILQAMLAALFGVIGYGMMFWGLLIIALIILDLILIVPNPKNLKTKLLAEWLIISIPFIYWTVKYHEWIFAVAIITFLITQLLREKYITKIPR